MFAAGVTMSDKATDRRSLFDTRTTTGWRGFRQPQMPWLASR
jgi:hypothetical protein